MNFCTNTLRLGWLLLAFVVQGLVLPVAQATNRANLSAQREVAVCPDQLAGEIRAIATRPAFQRTRWGILVRTLETGETLFAQESRQYFTPASTAKLLTTAAALEQLGPQFRIRTSVYRTAAQPDLVELGVVGRGDPSLADTQLQELAQQLQSQGINRVERLVGDDSYFQGDSVNPNWEWEDVQAGYGAPVNSLILNENAIALTLVPQALGQPLRVVWENSYGGMQWQIDNRSLTVAATEREFVQVSRDLSQPVLRVQGQLRANGEADTTAIAIPNPSQHFIERFRQILVSKQIAIAETEISSTPVASAGAEVAMILSPPLQELLVKTNQSSNNLYAESLLRQLGAERLSPSSPGYSVSTLEASVTAVETVLTRLGLDPDSYRLADGSGLSRHSLVSPEALVDVLRAMARSRHAAVFRNSLAVAGTSGTLRNRFRDTPVQNRLQGKTGAMSGVAALSGYLTPPNYPALTFSILVNQFDQPVSDVRPAIDEIVLLLGRLRTC